MTRAQPRETGREEIAEVAGKMAEAIEEVQQEGKARKHQISAQIDAENRRIDEAIRQGNEILEGKRE